MAGIAGNPSIVKSGLVLYLDAANRKSYRGTGTTWNDLSGNNRNGTLTNGPSFVNSNGGYFSFDGVDDYLSSPSIDMNTGTGFTVCLLFKQINPQVRSNWNYLYAQGNFEIGSYNGSPVEKYFIFKDNLIPLDTYVTNVSDSWNYLAFGTNATTRYPFVHCYNSSGYSTGTSSTSISLTSLNFTTFFYGAGPSGNLYYRANCAVIQAYNRTLSVAEVAQNYNATRNRFGI
jgi:hypothetical protein